jgi:mycoredoxin
MENSAMQKNDKVILYGTPTCAMVPPMRGILNRAEVAFEYVDIDDDPEGRSRVVAINEGNASVPTLVFSDGSTLTEPSTAVLKKKLESLGYTVSKPTLWQSLRDNPIYSLMGLVGILFGLYDRNWGYVLLGFAVLAYTVATSRQ